MKASSSAKSIESYTSEYLAVFHKSQPITLTQDDIQSFIDWGYTPSLGFGESEYQAYGQVMQWVMNLINDWKTHGTSLAMIKKVVSATRKRIGELEGLDVAKKNSIEIPLIARLFKACTRDIAQTNEDTRSNKTVESKIEMNIEDAKKLITHAISTLKSIDVIHNDFEASKVGVAIELLTGRRLFSEVFDTGSFLAISDNQLSFVGQAKNALKQGEAFNIFCLCDSALIEVKHDLLIDYMLEKSWYVADVKQSEKIQSNMVHPVMKALREYPTDINFSSHDFRKFYACYVFKIYAPTYDFARFIGEQLGHGYRDGAGNFICDGQTTGSYAKFVFVG